MDLQSPVPAVHIKGEVSDNILASNFPGTLASKLVINPFIAFATIQAGRLYNMNLPLALAISLSTASSQAMTSAAS